MLAAKGDSRWEPFDVEELRGKTMGVRARFYASVLPPSLAPPLFLCLPAPAGKGAGWVR